MEKLKPILDIKISRTKWVNMTTSEQDKYMEMLLSNMTDEQKIKVAEIGVQVAKDDILDVDSRHTGKVIRTMTRSVGITIRFCD